MGTVATKASKVARLPIQSVSRNLRGFRRLSHLIAAGLALLIANAPVNAAPALAPDADAWLVTAVQSGRTLASHRSGHAVDPGSLVKMMTAYIVFKDLEAGRIDLSSRIRINRHEWRMSGSQMFLEVDERISVDLLIQGMLVAGGNDAAHALARHVGPGLERFVAAMNRTADELGMTQTEFANPSGLPASGQTTTADDMALLARALIRRFPDRLTRFADAAITHNGIRQRNRNPLLGLIPGATGLMTGYTEANGYNLVGSASRDRLQLISIVLGADNPGTRLSAAAATLRHGFRHFETVRITPHDRTAAHERVWKGRSDSVRAILPGALHVTIRRDTARSLETRAETPERLVAPITQGDRIGHLQIRTDSGPVTRAPLLAARSVAVAGWSGYIMDTIQLRWQRFWQAQRRELLAGDPAHDGAGNPG